MPEKICPLRKENVYTYWGEISKDSPITSVKEKFLPCLGEYCMAWSNNYCKLINMSVVPKPSSAQVIRR